ncbi:MAG: alkaline phosphatase [Bryobacterales bacterium]|nr:alkaline phosphatase [Bryobacterales bacterium]
MRFALLLASIVCVTAQAAPRKARNIILFLGDAGGIPTLHATSLYKHSHPQKLFIQSMPHIALMDTSAADAWVTDSAAGMSAIVTGEKTNNGVISQSAAAVRGKQDGEALQTILEHAEQHGLSSGVITNMNITDATAAACYSHSNDRGASGPIFAQLLKPRFGDGADVIIGAGRKAVLSATAKLGLDIEPALREKGYAVYDSLDTMGPRDRRVVALFDTHNFSVQQAVDNALSILSKNPKGYFLMVEWDIHTDNLKRGLDQAAELDDVIRHVAGSVKDDTLILFAADHSFDIRVRGGRRGEPVLPEASFGDAAKPGPKSNFRVDNGHTGEQVLVAAKGPGAERVRGFIANSDLFRIMMAAYGWNGNARK